MFSSDNQVSISSFLRRRGYRLLSPFTLSPSEQRRCLRGGQFADIRSESLRTPWRGGSDRGAYRRTERHLQGVPRPETGRDHAECSDGWCWRTPAQTQADVSRTTESCRAADEGVLGGQATFQIAHSSEQDPKRICEIKHVDETT